MTYATFHLIFTLPALLVAGWFGARPPGDENRLPLTRWGVVLLALIAFVYTTPWDAELIERGVWFYGEGVVTATVNGIPLGEYAFFIIQSVLAGFILHALARRLPNALGADMPPTFGEQQARWAGIGIALQLTLFGILCLTHPPTFYLGAILAWAGPVLLFQWAVGGHYLWRMRGILSGAVFIATAWLWLVDRIAIGMGLWQFSPELTTGLAFFGLPIEEAAFFLVTNIMVGQGLVLYYQAVLAWNPQASLARNLALLTNGHAEG